MDTQPNNYNFIWIVQACVVHKSDLNFNVSWPWISINFVFRNKLQEICAVESKCLEWVNSLEYKDINERA